MSELIAVAQGIVILLLGAVIKGIFSINRHLGQLNGRLGKTETWQDGHTKLDDERHQENLGKFDAIFDAIKRRR